MNLTDSDVTPLHVAFETCEKQANKRGMRVTGSEIVGLVPRQAIIDAGTHYLRAAGRSAGVPEADIVQSAVISLGLNDVAPFNPKEKVIEYILAPERPLVSMSLQELADETSRDSAAPGGGSVAALAGALGAALAAMVSNLPHPKEAFSAKRDDLETVAVRAQEVKQQLLDAIDEDTWSFQRLMEANRMSGAERHAAVRQATIGAAEVPLGVAELCPEIVELCERAAELGMVASVSDAGVGATMARAAVVGAAMNVRINLQEMTDDPEAAALLDRAGAALQATIEAADRFVAEVWKRLGA
jgi:glutamate formiminotransferase/formiminotetrahydrofolate cyclodeaminase